MLTYQIENGYGEILVDGWFAEDDPRTWTEKVAAVRAIADSEDYRADSMAFALYETDKYGDGTLLVRAEWDTLDNRWGAY